ncbi:DUF1016 domain-containing protein [Parabacteroides acidifaciens]|uniref:DUF1016 domain-containing protein n=1 Tax=Parabacteroides acidifaciens TaxID=2290935 RepID=A0A3D8HIZ0_9BACT|nr:PDDEXK nuclease domain-containing protein [Parabacteroides acidifaciens]MBC8600834.1 DUF1016 domain-containing protein [Parabacteroides acidifaciens]RDU50557.1 DUF1016 domain-containing protein [Parabacteroides acidifaciens]
MKKAEIASDYKHWLQELKQRIRQSQIKAAVRVNTALLELYWSIGADIVDRQVEEKWGSGVIPQLSADLRAEFPEMQGFSTTNLWYIKKWYLFYSQEDIKLHQPGGELKLPAIILPIPWRHYVEIITKCKSVEEALFYARKVSEEGWSRKTLLDYMEVDLYATQGHAITNFTQTLPAERSGLAIETLKDPYTFDFLTLSVGYKERELEDALVQNITKFLLELGTGFAYVGRQVEVVVGDSSYFMDMLFYHIKLKCYVVVELKTVKFEPEFAGKLNFYVTAVDRQMREESDNPTIGLLICKTKDNVIAEYSLSDIHKPLGISAYNLKNILPEDLQSSLPSIEEVEEGLSKI